MPGQSRMASCRQPAADCKQLTDAGVERAGIPVIVQVTTLEDVAEAVHGGAAAIIAQVGQ